MRLLDLHIDGFGKFHDLSVSFTDGLNIIYGKNEAGKSTLHTFIRCMLFGLERGRGRASRGDLYSRYEPWGGKGAYGGRLRLEKNGVVYRLERSFRKDKKSFVIVSETAGKEVEPSKAFLDSLLCGLTETTYNNTISIGQLKSATDSGMVSELRNYIANMNTTGSMALNVTRAASYLKAKRKEFERQLVPEAARTYASLLSEIHIIEKEISSPEYVNQLKTYQEMRTQVKELLAEKQEEREALLQKISKGHQALESAQLTSQDAIAAYQQEAEETFRHYCELQGGRQAKKRLLGAAASFGAALLTAVGGAFFLLSHPSSAAAGGQGAGMVILLFGLCILMCAAGTALTFQRRALTQETAMTGKILQEMFSRHLGDSSISPEAMDALRTRLEEFLRLSQILERSQASVQEQAAEIASLQERESSCDDNISRQQRFQWELEKKLDHLSHCRDQVETLKQVIAENDRIREEITAIDLALETITELSATIRDSFGLYLNGTASSLIAGITGGAYDSISVDESLNVFLNTPSKLVPAEQVSSGTMDQVYLALRLSAASLIQSDDDQMPLIFDDSFALYDDDRLSTALRWLTASFRRQMILFTCHKREARILKQEGIPFGLTRL